MTKEERYDRTYLNMATEWAKLSHCSRKQVGALIVKNGMIISDGYNGTPTGFENECEYPPDEVTSWGPVLKTKWYVLHAEANAITKLAKSGESSRGAVIFCTHLQVSFYSCRRMLCSLTLITMWQ